MDTNKLLFTIFFACISFTSKGKNMDLLLTVDIEDTEFHCAADIPIIYDPGVLCLNNQYTFEWLHEGPEVDLFLYYEWELLDQHGVKLRNGIRTNATATITIPDFTAATFQVRSVHGLPNDPDNLCRGYWATLPIDVIRGTFPIEDVTSTGSFCPNEKVRFTALHHSSENDSYQWYISFGAGNFLTSSTVGTGSITNQITVPSGYQNGDAVSVHVAPINNTCGIGTFYSESYVPSGPFTPWVKEIIDNPPYCSGNTNVFEVLNPIVGTEYQWRILLDYSTIPIANNFYQYMTGFELSEITLDFGQASVPGPYGVGKVVRYKIDVRGRSGCQPWPAWTDHSVTATTNYVSVSYGNCNPISNITNRSPDNELSKSQVENQEVLKMNIYPNPSSSGIFNIDISGFEGDKTIQVYDMSGRYVIEEVLLENQSKLDLSSYARGLYFVKVLDDTHQKIQKIIF